MTDTPQTMTQEAPYPDALASLVERMEYRPGWHFSLEDLDRGQGSKGLTFKVLAKGYDTYNPESGENYRVWHYFIVPAASYNEQSWRRWIFNCLLDIERHEAAEFFQIDDTRPYAPNHGPGNDPYFLVPEELTTEEERRIRFDGTVAETGSSGS